MPIEAKEVEWVWRVDLPAGAAITTEEWRRLQALVEALPGYLDNETDELEGPFWIHTEEQLSAESLRTLFAGLRRPN